MIKNLDELEKLSMSKYKRLWMDLILQFLTSSYGKFIINYYMNKIDCTLVELVTTDGILKSSRRRVPVHLENLEKRIRGIPSKGMRR